MSGKMFQLTVTQLDWLSTHYPTVAHYTEGGGNYFNPPSPNSPNAGYSFGPFQFDVNGNYGARTFLRQLTLNGQPVFTANDINALMANGGISSSNLADLNNQLAQALQDPSNQALYQNLQTGQLQNLEAQLQAAINYAANNGQSAIANEILNDPGARGYQVFCVQGPRRLFHGAARRSLIKSKGVRRGGKVGLHFTALLS